MASAIICRILIDGLKSLPSFFKRHSIQMMKQISRFMESSFIVQNQKFSTTEAVDSFNNIIYTACSKSLKTINRLKNLREN